MYFLDYMRTYISHRGNLIGPMHDLENRPEYILNALNSGFDCECDVWWHSETWWLGHDKPQYQTNEVFLKKDRLWIHAKNLDALHRLLLLRVHCFFHHTDDYTLTSKGHIWAYPGSKITGNTVCVMPEHANNIENSKAWAICSDYVVAEKLEEIRGDT